MAQSNCVNQNVVTGYGYLTNAQGQIFSYAQYPLGSVCIPQGVTYTEVADLPTLRAIPLYTAPLTSQQQTAALIAEDEQNLAIQDLVSQGLLTSDQATTASQSLTTLTAAQKSTVNTKVNP